MRSTTLPPNHSNLNLMFSNSPLSCSPDAKLILIFAVIQMFIHQCTNSRSRRLSCRSLDIPKMTTNLTSRSRNKRCPSSYSRLLQLIDQAHMSTLLLTQGHQNSRTSTPSSLLWMSIFSNSKKSTRSGLRPRRKSKLMATSIHVISQQIAYSQPQAVISVYSLASQSQFRIALSASMISSQDRIGSDNSQL